VFSTMVPAWESWLAASVSITALSSMRMVSSIGVRDVRIVLTNVVRAPQAPPRRPQTTGTTGSTTASTRTSRNGTSTGHSPPAVTDGVDPGSTPGRMPCPVLIIDRFPAR